MQDGTFLKIIFWIFLSIAFFIILTLPTESIENQTKNEKTVGNSHICDSLKCEINNQSMTKNWGWTNNYCLKKLYFKDGSIMQIPRCGF